MQILTLRPPYVIALEIIIRKSLSKLKIRCFLSNSHSQEPLVAGKMTNIVNVNFTLTLGAREQN